mgnify:CR=1 FL=1
MKISDCKILISEKNYAPIKSYISNISTNLTETDYFELKSILRFLYLEYSGLLMESISNSIKALIELKKNQIVIDILESKEIINSIKNDVCLFIYKNDAQYLKKSSVFNEVFMLKFKIVIGDAALHAIQIRHIENIMKMER